MWVWTGVVKVYVKWHNRRMEIRNRIKRLDRVPVAKLRPNAKNWRTHPDKQRNALKGLLAEVGFAVPLIARETEDGALELIDGHLRAETLPDEEVSVVVLDVTEEEAAKLLATLDPLAALAGKDESKLVELLSEIDSDSAAVQEMLSNLVSMKTLEGDIGVDESDKIQERFEIVIECEDEAEHRALLDRFLAEGLKCRALIS
jgi:hypothetical protein